MKSKENISTINIDMRSNSQISELADLFANVFAGPPWNEVTKCANTGDFYGSETRVGTPCPDCQTPLIEAYPKDKTISYIMSEMGKDNPIGLLAFVNSELAGFSWGYQTDAKSLVKSKWKTQQMQKDVLGLLNRYGVKEQLFYGSETGVDPKFQGQGLGKKLVKTRLAQVNQSGAEFMLVRTNFSSPMYGICKQLPEFTQILGPVAQRGLFNKKYQPSFKYINAIDSENVDRVLFLYDKVEFQRPQLEGGTMH